MRKRLVTVMIAIMLIISSFTISNASDASAALVTAKTKLKAGEMFKVEFSVSCDEGINGVEVKFDYDNTILELQSAQIKDTTNWSNLGGQTDITVICNSSETIKSATIYELIFKIKDDAEVGKTATISTGTISVDSDAQTNSGKTVGAKSLTVEVVTEESNSGSGQNNNEEQPGENNQEENKPEENVSKLPEKSNIEKGKQEVATKNVETQKITTKKDNTTSDKTMPKTGRDTLVTFAIWIEAIVIATIALLYIGFIKYRNNKK